MDEEKNGETVNEQQSYHIQEKEDGLIKDGITNLAYDEELGMPDSKSLGVSIELGIMDETKEATNDDKTAEFEETSPLLYRVSDSPPILLTLFLGLQQTLISLSGSLLIPLLVAKAVCAEKDGQFLTKLVSSTLVMNGITSLMQTVLGIRLPLFQGPTAMYIVPLLSLSKMDPSRCDISQLYARDFNSTTNNGSITELEDQLVDTRVRELMGPLILAGVFHCLIGATGLVGLLLRFIGPITIVPTIFLIGIYIVKPVLEYTEVHWGISTLTFGVSVILSMYLGSRPMLVPMYTRKKGFHCIRYPLHRVFAILIAIVIGWAVCGIMTASGAFTNDPNSLQFNARTDARANVFQNSPWFYFPYPGQFGVPAFSLPAFLGFMLATLTSILDSIGDYYACAGMCRVPPPPAHAVNRGIAIEGFCTILSGLMGTGHATTTYGGNIGAIGMTKVASRKVFVAMSFIYIIFGAFTKISAIFVSIPYPVLGGATVTIIGVFVGVNLSNLSVIDMSSTRNLSIIGIGIFVGLLVPTWMEKNPKCINTGNEDLDQFITILLSSPNFLGGALACFMDNSIPGTDEERGISSWQQGSESFNDKGVSIHYLEGPEVYEPLFPKKWSSYKIIKFIPVLHYQEYKQEEEAVIPTNLNSQMLSATQKVEAL
ncbi:hypothetical protein ACJMK2_005032 [Sinanodonta woodiana]|uniref:Solute carrier family 23 member 2 n=1 Tax=Sinanodonta woodiana TaxID=1069815 RepID=A0ABD3VNU5_SINWO